MSTDIILIGPVGVGKSTIGQLLSEKLGLPQCAMDEVRWGYYNEIGYDKALAREKLEKGGFWSLYQY